jgi:hypothetical protein
MQTGRMCLPLSMRLPYAMMIAIVQGNLIEFKHQNDLYLAQVFLMFCGVLLSFSSLESKENL